LPQRIMNFADLFFALQILCVVVALPAYLASRRTPRTRRAAHKGYAALAIVLLVCAGVLAVLSLQHAGAQQIQDAVFDFLLPAITAVFSVLTLRRSLSAPPVRGQRLRT
jgi:drug/metabolite transporter (DMT)-like permease